MRSRGRSTPSSASPWTCRSSSRAKAARSARSACRFNNDGPLGTFFRYIGDTATYIARYDDLVTGKEEPIDLTGVTVSNNGIELQDREFIAAIREGREPNSSVAQVLDCYRVIGELAASLEAAGRLVLRLDPRATPVTYPRVIQVASRLSEPSDIV